MGRWSQQWRRGSSPPGEASSALLTLDFVALDTVTSVSMTFSGEVDAGDFAPGDFEIDNGGGFLPAISIVQDSTNVLIADNPAWFPFVGSPWQLIGGPPDVLVPQNGVVLP